MHRTSRLLLALALVVPVLGCRSTYYETLELFGTHKRDILVDRVSKARGAQADAQEEIVDTLAAFQELIGSDGGSLGLLYERLRRQHVRAEDKAAQLHQRIDAIESVALDLFIEWRRELETIQNPDLRSRSAAMLETREAEYGSMLKKMRTAAERMEPVLVTFRDHVTFLKHSLNAKAVDDLRETRAGIEADVDELVREMQAAILEAETFIREMRLGEGIDA